MKKRVISFLLMLTLVFGGMTTSGIQAEAVWKANSTGWWWQEDNGTYPTNAWKSIGGSWYYFNGSGYMTTGWQSIGGSWYYMNGSGAMTTGWQSIGGSWYYMNGSGAMTTGWQSIGGSWYYMNGSGAMEANKWIDGVYYVGSNGAMATNQWIGNYYVGADGKWIPDQKKPEEHKHIYGERVTKQATCTEEGVITCACSCGDVYTVAIPKKGHNSSDWQVTQNPTHTANGSKHKVCTVCGVELAKESIPSNGNHNYQWAESGNTRVMKCSCGATTGRTETNYYGAWGYYDDNAAAPLLNYINAQRENAETGKEDNWGNPIEAEIPILSGGITENAKKRAAQYATNSVLNRNECLTKGNYNAMSVQSKWMASGRERDILLGMDYTKGETACFMHSNNDGTYTPIWVLVLN